MVDDTLFQHQYHHNQHKTFDTTKDAGGESGDVFVLFQDVLPAGSRFFPLVYLGALADFFARRRGKIKSRTSRIVRNKFVRYISAHRMARNILHKFRHTNAEIFYAGHNPQ